MKKIKIKTLYLIGIISIGLIGLGVGSTYAMFTTSVEINNPISMITTLTSESEIIETINVTVDASSHKEIPITINNTSTSTLNYSVWYMSTSSDIEVGTNLSNSDSSSPSGTISNSDTKTVYVRLKNNSSSDVIITLGVSSNINSIVLSNNMTMVPNIKIVFEANLARYITNLYINAAKTTVTNNSITYNTAPSVGLMNDRLGSSSTNINGGNIRYYGASPNNYIYFNCSDYSNQSSSTCETWRIIGVFGGKVKIMRGSTIGSYAWDNKNTSTGAESNNGKNDWTDARLMKLLNPGYESETTGGSLYYNSGSGSCYSGQNNATTTCDFTSTGIKNDTTRNLISDTLYYLGGYSNESVYSDQMYGYERGTEVYEGNPTTWTGKIALAYPSDYGYAADLGSCTVTLSNYFTCRSTNWMKNIITNNGSSWGWFLTPDSWDSYYAWNVNSSGDAGYDDNSYPYCANLVVPVLYLGSEQRIDIDSVGTSANPYRLIVG